MTRRDILTETARPIDLWDISGQRWVSWTQDAEIIVPAIPAAARCVDIGALSAAITQRLEADIQGIWAADPAPERGVPLTQERIRQAIADGWALLEMMPVADQRAWGAEPVRDDSAGLPDDTACTFAEWSAKVDRLLAECTWLEESGDESESKGPAGASAQGGREREGRP